MDKLYMDKLLKLLEDGYSDNNELIAFALVGLALEQKRFNDAVLEKLEFLNVNAWGELEIAVITHE